MNIGNAFPSDFLKAADFERPALLTMTVVEEREIGDDHKHVLFFNEIEKGLVLNKTNASYIQALYGPMTEDWSGQAIVVFATETDYQGKRVPCLRVRAPKHNAKAAPQKPAIKQPVRKGAPAQKPAEDLSIPEDAVPDEEIPF